MTKNKMRPIHPGEILREEFLKPPSLSPSTSRSYPSPYRSCNMHRFLIVLWSTLKPYPTVRLSRNGLEVVDGVLSALILMAGLALTVGFMVVTMRVIRPYLLQWPALARVVALMIGCSYIALISFRCFRALFRRWERWMGEVKDKRFPS